jgi:hypothetical protein
MTTKEEDKKEIKALFGAALGSYFGMTKLNLNLTTIVREAGHLSGDFQVNDFNQFLKKPTLDGFLKFFLPFGPNDGSGYSYGPTDFLKAGGKTAEFIVTLTGLGAPLLCEVLPFGLAYKIRDSHPTGAGFLGLLSISNYITDSVTLFSDAKGTNIFSDSYRTSQFLGIDPLTIAIIYAITFPTFATSLYLINRYRRGREEKKNARSRLLYLANDGGLPTEALKRYNEYDRKERLEKLEEESKERKNNGKALREEQKQCWKYLMEDDTVKEKLKEAIKAEIESYKNSIKSIFNGVDVIDLNYTDQEEIFSLKYLMHMNMGDNTTVKIRAPEMTPKLKKEVEYGRSILGKNKISVHTNGGVFNF